MYDAIMPVRCLNLHGVYELVFCENVVVAVCVGVCPIAFTIIYCSVTVFLW